jgi:uncharacterized protein (TIGR02147 family)
MELKPSVFEYGDYRAFLNDHFLKSKVKKKTWSYGAWARQLGLKSSSTLIMILNGGRNPGPKLVQKLANQMKLKGAEVSYFEDLVRLSKVKNDQSLRVLLMERLKERHPKKHFQFLDAATFKAISSWHFYALREMVELPSFREDPEWISKILRFHVSPGEVQNAIEILVDKKLLKRTSAGKLTTSSTALDSGTDIANEGLKRFHEQMLDNARTSIRKCEVSDRDITGLTVALPHKNIARAKSMIRKFEEDFMSLLGSEPGEDIYQLEVAFFPLTKIGEHKI